VSEQFKWAPYKRVKEAAEELKAAIRARYPDAQFRLSRAQDDRDAWNLWTLVDLDDPDEVRDVVRDRELDMLAEEHIPITVVPTQAREQFMTSLPERRRKTG
jgi:hypothetical protein